MTLAEDLAIYLPRLGRLQPLDRYARTARFAPDSNEAVMLEAMRHARFSLWRVERRHESAGLLLRDLRDLLRGGEIRLVDETMEKTAPQGVGWPGVSCKPRRLTWANKTVMIAEFIHPKSAVIEAQERKFLMENLLPPERWHVWMARYEGEMWRDLSIYQHSGTLEVPSVSRPGGVSLCRNQRHSALATCFSTWSPPHGRESTYHSSDLECRGLLASAPQPISTLHGRIPFF